MKNKLIIVTLLTMILSGSLRSQDVLTADYNYPYKNTFYTGGGVSAQFGSVTMIDISPQIGYYLLENISVGIGGTYQYINDRYYHARLNVFGGRVFTRLHLPFFNSIFAHLEYEYLAYKTSMYSISGTKAWIHVNSALVGVGYRQAIFGRSNIHASLLWNVNETEFTPYNNPVIRIGFDIGL